ncbi:MAG: SDR family oxidoreductase [Cellvibrionaceae bacterium]
MPIFYWKNATRAAASFLGMVIVGLALAGNATAQDQPSMAGKTVLVTGSTEGMGREVAMRLGALGAHVVVHGRNAERGKEVVEAINGGAGTAEFYQADFGDLDNVRELAERVIRNHEELHLLINNAGIGSGFRDGQRTLSEDGYEMLFQVNYLAHYLLTDLLLPAIKNSAPARIINVASGAQRPINFDDVMLEDNYVGGTAYAQSKLAQILHTFYLAQKLEGTGVTFNTLHPATMMDTTMVEMSGRPARTTVDEGATALMNLAVSPDLEGRSGLYFNGLNESRANAQAYDQQARERLDKLSRELVGL